MEYRRLGGSGLMVSPLTFGVMTFGGESVFAQVGSTQVDEARELVAMSRDAGVNLFDTADVYSWGASERILGEALGDALDDVLIATKVGMRVGEAPNARGLSRKHIIRQCEQSLRNLGRDYIDLYQVHSWDGLTPLEETLSVLGHLVDQGKVRYVGCSNYSAWQLVKALGIASREHLPPFVVTQNFYSPAFRDVEMELLPAAIDAGIGLLVWSPLAGGLTSGKYRRDRQPETGRQLTEWDEPPVDDPERLWQTVDVLVEVGQELGCSAARVSLAWLLTRPGVSSVIIGARTTEQLADNLAAMELQLTIDQTERIERASRPHLPYPIWHQRKTVAARLSEADKVLPLERKD
jgi:aryl-alcohol dehydrogenase-like predicted oxidoreductase